MKFIISPFTIFNLSNRIILDIIINNHLQWLEYDESVFSLEKCNVFSIIFSRKVLCIFLIFSRKLLCIYYYFIYKNFVFSIIFSRKVLPIYYYFLYKNFVFSIIFSTKTLFFLLFSLEKTFCSFSIIFSKKTLFIFIIFSRRMRFSTAFTKKVTRSSFSFLVKSFQ